MLRSTIFMDLLGESPIGAWATFDCPLPEHEATAASRDKNDGLMDGVLGANKGEFFKA
jgi:hypothetical protein